MSTRGCNRLEGLLTSASLIWTATPLTTAKFYSDTQIAETTLPGTSGVLMRTYTVRGRSRFPPLADRHRQIHLRHARLPGRRPADKIYSLSGDLIYKLNRNLWLKGTLRRDWLDSTSPGSSSASTVVMLGVRLQN